MRSLFALTIAVTLLTSCQKQVTPDPSTKLAYPGAVVVADFTMKTGGVMPSILPVAKNTSHPTDQPKNLAFRGSIGHENIEVNYECFGRFNEGDVYAFSVTTNNGKKILPLYKIACFYYGKETLVLDTNEVKIIIKQQ